jgi:hypothetical protein
MRFSSALPLLRQQLQPAFNLPQGELPGAAGAQPKMLYALVFRGEAKKSAAFQPQELPGTLRIGTL